MTYRCNILTSPTPIHLIAARLLGEVPVLRYLQLSILEVDIIRYVACKAYLLSDFPGIAELSSYIVLGIVE